MKLKEVYEVHQGKRYRVEGYWKNNSPYCKDTWDYPIPETSNDNWFILNKTKILQKISDLEQTAQQRHYRGFSCCRMCGCHNGSSEYVYKDVIWPSGFKHYIQEHNVCPSEWFLKFIGIPKNGTD